MSCDAWVIVVERDEGVFVPAHPTFLDHDTALVTAAVMRIHGAVFRVWDAAKWDRYIADRQRCS